MAYTFFDTNKKTIIKENYLTIYKKYKPLKNILQSNKSNINFFIYPILVYSSKEIIENNISTSNLEKYYFHNIGEYPEKFQWVINKQPRYIYHSIMLMSEQTYINMRFPSFLPSGKKNYHLCYIDRHSTLNWDVQNIYDNGIKITI